MEVVPMEVLPAPPAPVAMSQLQKSQDELVLPSLWPSTLPPSRSPLRLLDLHYELLVLILQKLSVRDQAQCARTCRQLRELLFDPTFKRLHIARFRQRLFMGYRVQPYLLPFVDEVSFENPSIATTLLGQFASVREPLRLRRVAFTFGSTARSVAERDWHLLIQTLVSVGSITDVIFEDVHLPPQVVQYFERMHSLRSIAFKGALPVTDAIVPYLAFTPLEALCVHDARSWMDTGLMALNRLQSLKKLQLVGCSAFVDAYFEQLSELKNLHELCLDGCTQITDVGLASIVHLTQLQELSLVNCFYVSDPSLSHISHLPKLRRLDLSQCFRVTDAGLVFLSSMASLCHLAVRQCSRITSIGLYCLGSHRCKLISLDVGRCGELTEDSVAWLAQRLAMPDVERYTTAAVIPSALPSIFELEDFDRQPSLFAQSSLQVLRMDSYRALSSRALHSIILDTPHLTELCLSNCPQITDEYLRLIANLPLLERLDLHCCLQVTDDGVAALVACTKLQSLNVSWCTLLTDRLFQLLSPLQDLRELDVSGCSQLSCMAAHYLSRVDIVQNTPKMHVPDGLGKV